MAIVNQQLTTTQLDMITVPANKSYAITNILVCNNGSATASFDMHLIPQSSSLSNTVTRVINNLELPAGETFTFDSEKVILSAGDSVTLLSQAPLNLSVTVSYLEV